MRTIIAGSRSCTSYKAIEAAMNVFGHHPSVVLSGTARGADRLGEEWAKLHGVPIEYYPANWDEYGKAAGLIRNGEMAHNADALVALWDGQSRGTQHMIQVARERGLKVFVWRMM